MAWHSTWNPSPSRRGFWADRGGMFPPGVKLVLILTIAAYFLEKAFPDFINLCSLSASGVMHLELWRLVTYMLLHDPTRLDHILVNLFVFWMLGSVLERQLGTRQFLWLYLAAGIIGGLFEVGFNAAMYQYGWQDFYDKPTVGASAGVMGVLVAFATLNPRAEFLVFFLLPVEAWLAALVYGLFETWPIFEALYLGGQLPQDNVAHAAHFGGMAAGFIWIRWGARLWGLVRARPMRVVREPPLEHTEDDEVELDRILDKIHRDGLGSLTTSERMFLQEMSRRKKQ